MIAQAKNQVRLYAVIRLVTSVLGLVLSYFLAEKYSDIGCAVGVFVALLIQTLAINVFYRYKLELNVSSFVLEIIKSSFANSTSKCKITKCLCKSTPLVLRNSISFLVSH